MMHAFYQKHIKLGIERVQACTR